MGKRGIANIETTIKATFRTFIRVLLLGGIVGAIMGHDDAA